MRTRSIILAFMLSGAASLAYEVVWTRALSLVLGSTTYAMSTVLAAFMSGLAIGAWLGGRLVRDRDPVAVFAGLELGIALSGFTTFYAIRHLSPAYGWIYYTFHEVPAAYYALQYGLVVLLVLVPTTCMGATFPAVVKSLTRSLDTAPEDVGSLYSLNTVGAVIGSIAGGFVLIPLLGMQGANTAAALLNATGAFLLLAGRWHERVVVGSALLAGALFFSLVKDPIFPLNLYIAGRAGSWQSYEQGVEGANLLWQAHDVEGEVQVTAIPGTRLFGMYVSGRPEGMLGAVDEANQRLMAELPLAVMDEARSLLKVGLGPGVTLQQASLHPELEVIDAVEINASVVEVVGALFYPQLFEDPRVHVRVDDARFFLERRARTYDVITAQASDPTSGSTASLFTREYFEAARDNLSPGGVFCQYVPTYLLDDEALDVAVKTFAQVFPYVEEWTVQTGAENMLLLGSGEPMPPPNVVDERVIARNPDLSGTFDHLAAHKRIAMLLADTRIAANTDDRPVLEFLAVAGLTGYRRGVSLTREVAPDGALAER